jgi:hypothetical protein
MILQQIRANNRILQQKRTNYRILQQIMGFYGFEGDRCGRPGDTLPVAGNRGISSLVWITYSQYIDKGGFKQDILKKCYFGHIFARRIAYSTGGATSFDGRQYVIAIYAHIKFKQIPYKSLNYSWLRRKSLRRRRNHVESIVSK